MQKSASGFTIVELIVIIVVLGIIATIAIVSYSNIPRIVQNNERIAELRGWKAAFEKYKAANGQYPTAAVSSGAVIYCLGTDFPNQKCRSGTGTENEAASAWLMNELAPYDPPPSGPRTLTGHIVGPWGEWTTSYIRLATSLEGGDADCPDDTAFYWGSDDFRVCRFILRR